MNKFFSCFVYCVEKMEVKLGKRIAKYKHKRHLAVNE